MDLHEFLEYHRDAAGDDVNFAFERAGIKASPTTPAELLELFNCILEIRMGEDDVAEIGDEVNSASHFRSADIISTD